MRLEFDRLEIGNRDNVSTGNLVDADVRQINSRPRSRFGDLQIAPVTLNRPNAPVEIARLDNNSLLAA